MINDCVIFLLPNKSSNSVYIYKWEDIVSLLDVAPVNNHDFFSIKNQESMSWIENIKSDIYSPLDRGGIRNYIMWVQFHFDCQFFTLLLNFGCKNSASIRFSEDTVGAIANPPLLELDLTILYFLFIVFIRS